MSTPEEKVVDPGTTPQTQTPEAPVEQPTEQKLSLSLEELKAITKSAIEEALKKSKEDSSREEIADYNKKLADAVKTSQSSLTTPNLTDGQQSLDYIKRVFAEDNRQRLKHPEGKAFYSDKGEDFLKAKIILLKKIGLTEEEIAKEIGSML